ncbi:MAG: nucleotide exchange factor GrpE [Candidatus Peribacteria bacterium]|nr:nucleotide exchange factor GrpE [Candidatus Peribacteria bacterium]
MKENLEETPNHNEEKYKDILTKTAADFENYKKEVERNRDDMTFNFKSELFKNILPRVNDLERIIANTPEDLKNTPLYE